MHPGKARRKPPFARFPHQVPKERRSSRVPWGDPSGDPGMASSTQEAERCAGDKKKPCRRTCRAFSIGSPSRTRTSDPVVNSHLLYRLSYRGSVRPGPSVGRPVRVVCGPGFYHRFACLSSFIFGRFQSLLGSFRYAGILPEQDGRAGGRGRDRTADRGFAVPCITTLLPGHRVFTAGRRSDP